MWQLVGDGDTAAAVTLLQGLNETAGILIPFALVSFGFAIGMALLAVGLYRARAVQSWMAVCVGVGSIVFGLGIATAMNWLTIVAAAFLVVGLGVDRPHGPERDRRGLGAHSRVRGLPPRARDALVPVTRRPKAAARVRQHGRPKWAPVAYVFFAMDELAEQVVEAINDISGRHEGHRAAHAKGTLLAGTFTPSALGPDHGRAHAGRARARDRALLERRRRPRRSPTTPRRAAAWR